MADSLIGPSISTAIGAKLGKNATTAPDGVHHAANKYVFNRR